MRVRVLFFLCAAALALLTTTAIAQDSLNVHRAAALRGDWERIYGLDLEGDLLYLATGTTGLHIVNVADPRHPVEIGNCGAQGYRVTVEGSHAYVAGMSRLTVVNVENPAAPEVAGFATDALLSSTYDMQESGGLVYVVTEGCSEGECDQYLTVVNVSDPQHPAVAGDHDFEILYGVAASGGHIFLAQADIGFSISAVTSPFDPLAYTYLMHPMDVEIAGGRAFLSCPGSFVIASIEDPAHPAQIGECDIDATCACKLAIDGNTAFIGDLYNGLHVVNYIDNTRPEESGYYNPGITMRDVAARGDYAYAAVESTLVVFDCSQSVPAAPQTQPAIPQQARLDACYPNPFNAAATIRYDLPVQTKITLSVYDVLGRRAAVLVDGMQTAGTHQAHFDGSGLASGVYYIILQSADFELRQKAVLLK